MNLSVITLSWYDACSSILTSCPSCMPHSERDNWASLICIHVICLNTVTHLEQPWRWTARPTFCLRHIWRWNMWIHFFLEIRCRNLWSTHGITCCRTTANSRSPPGARSSSMNWSTSCSVCLDLSSSSSLSCRSIRSNRYVISSNFFNLFLF